METLDWQLREFQNGCFFMVRSVSGVVFCALSLQVLRTNSGDLCGALASIQCRHRSQNLLLLSMLGGVAHMEREEVPDQSAS